MNCTHGEVEAFPDASTQLSRLICKMNQVSRLRERSEPHLHASSGVLLSYMTYSPLQKRERTGKKYGFFRLFEKLRYSNERSAKFESLKQE